MNKKIQCVRKISHSSRTRCYVRMHHARNNFNIWDLCFWKKFLTSYKQVLDKTRYTHCWNFCCNVYSWLRTLVTILKFQQTFILGNATSNTRITATSTASLELKQSDENSSKVMTDHECLKLLADFKKLTSSMENKIWKRKQKSTNSVLCPRRQAWYFVRSS